jgi:hypothetical protein
MELDNTNELNEQTQREKELKKLEFALMYYIKLFKKSTYKDEKIKNFMEIRKIINTMYYFPELHNSNGLLWLND